MASRPRPAPAGPGQESVWDYPRPPRLERTARALRVDFAGEVLAQTARGYRVLETSHPPVYYFPPGDVDRALLARVTGDGSRCEFKGEAVYYDAVVGGQRAARAAWSYPDPVEAFLPVAGYLAFYPGRVDACFVDGIRVRPQEGGFYGGWITPDVVGPFKGGAGTWGW